MDERDRERQLIDARPKGMGRPRVGVGTAKGGVEDALWFVRRRLAWPLADAVGRFEPRGLIGVLGGGGIAVAGVVAALVLAGPGGAGSGTGTTEAFVSPPRIPAATVPARTPAPRAKAKRPAGPTLHGAPPDFSPAKHAKAGVGNAKALGGKHRRHRSGGVEAERGGTAREVKASATDAPAATAKIGSTPAATASAARTDSLSGSGRGAVGTPAGSGTGGKGGAKFSGPPAPKAAKRMARRFAEAFVVYEIGGTDGAVRHTFGATTTKQLSRALLHQPPRQPAGVKVPKAKVVNVVAGPSRGGVYTLSVALLRVGVTSELRLQMERGAGGKWQVTNVLG